MTAHPGAAPTPAPMARAFPAAGPLVEHAYRELGIAANGTEQEIEALGNLRLLPRPFDPPSCTSPELRLQVWAWLEDVVTWLNTEYVWDTASMIPTCWPHHPHLVHELAVLADQRRRASFAYTSDLLEEWHRYALPAFTDRNKTRLKQHCDDGHQPWPATGRHSRHTSHVEASNRVDLYRCEATALRDAGGVPAGVGHGEVRPSLTLLEGELVDTRTGEVFPPQSE